jgi:hypothetical protein
MERLHDLVHGENTPRKNMPIHSPTLYHTAAIGATACFPAKWKV